MLLKFQPNPAQIVVTPSFQAQLSSDIGADVRIDILPTRSHSVLACAQWTGADPWVSSIEVDAFGVKSEIDLYQKLKSGLLRNRVRENQYPRVESKL